MYLTHFGLNEPPYRITPHTEFFFAGANRGATLEALLYAITHDEGIVKVTGEVGSGKTMLCRVLIERLPESVETIYLSNPSLARDEIVLAIFDDLKIPATEQRSTLQIRALQDHLIALYAAGKRVVLLIDEAHAMPAETLEEIRLLSNLESNRHKLLQIALFGQQELDEHLLTPRMRPLRERVTHSFRLEPLVHADVGQYLMFRLRQAGYKGPDLFDRDAVKMIAQASEGLTRRINILADKALLSAFMEGEHGINKKHAQAAINDSEFAPMGRRHAAARLRFAWPKWARWSAGIAGAAALVGAGLIAGINLRQPLPAVASAAQAANQPRPATDPVTVPNQPSVTPVNPSPAPVGTTTKSTATSTAPSIAPLTAPSSALASTPSNTLRPAPNPSVIDTQAGRIAPAPVSPVPVTGDLRRPVPLPVPQISASVVPASMPAPAKAASKPAATPAAIVVRDQTTRFVAGAQPSASSPAASVSEPATDSAASVPAAEQRH